jgi:hypothetical protein
MGFAALIVFFAGLGTGLFCLALPAWSAVRLYKTLRCSFRDASAWAETFREMGERTMCEGDRIRKRMENISRSWEETLRNVEEVRAAVEDLRTHPLLRGARFLADRRSRRG